MNWDNVFIHTVVSCIFIAFTLIWAVPKIYALGSSDAGISTMDITAENASTVQKPFIAVISWFEVKTHNYGIAIILTSFLLKLLMHPLTRWNFFLGKKMRGVQPLIIDLKEKYKDDPMELRVAISKLFQENQVNPLGPIVAMIPQIPLFLAMNAVITHWVEFKNSPFFAWVRDLSVRDPLYILPILLSIGMYVQARFGVSTEGTPQAMIYVAPLLALAFMITMPAGLLLYSLSGMVFSAAETRYLKRRFG